MHEKPNEDIPPCESINANSSEGIMVESGTVIADISVKFGRNFCFDQFKNRPLTYMLMPGK